MGDDKKKFSPPWWLRNRHVQSCVGAFLPSRFNPEARWEEFNLPDGDFIDLAWVGDSGKPIVFILTGFEGAIDSHYVQLMSKLVVNFGWQACIMHYRCCSGRINRFPRTYHVGDFTDLHHVVSKQVNKNPRLPCFAIGFSMGSNVLAKYLYNYPASPLRAGCLVSCPFQVADSVDHCSYFYQRRFVYSVVAKLMAKLRAGYQLPISHDEIMKINYMRDIDRLVTAPFFNYANENDYYNYASISDDLPAIDTPLLLLHAKDDPIAPVSCVPEISQLHSNTR